MAAASAEPPGAALVGQRLRRELAALQRAPNPQIEVRPSDGNMLVMHFVLHSLPADTPFGEGCYHGVMAFPPEYPHSPPAARMLTPSGRLPVGRSICLPMSSYHLAPWNPVWTLETILLGLLESFLSGANLAPVVDATDEERRAMARGSWAFNAEDGMFVELFPDFLGGPRHRPLGRGADAEAGGPTACACRAACACGSAAEDAASDSGAATSAAAPPPKRQETAGDGGADDEEAECWICRLPAGGEPLVRPCACRGSMGGVHRSCLERWVGPPAQWELAYWRQVALPTPRCPTCHCLYSGYPQLPLPYGRSPDGRCLTLLRFFGVAWAVALLGCALKAEVSGRMAAMLATPFGLLLAHHALAILVWFPWNGPGLPPRPAALAMGALRRVLPAKDSPALLQVSNELDWLMQGMAVQYVLGNGIALQHVLAYYALYLLLAAREREVHSRAVDLVRAAVLVVACAVASPLVPLYWLGHLVCWHFAAVLHPLGPGPHCVAALLVVPGVVFLGTSASALAVALGGHTALLLLLIAERALLGRLPWRPGSFWWLAAYAAVCSVVAVDFVLPQDDDADEVGRGRGAMALLGMAWTAAILVLALLVNWPRVVRRHRAWEPGLSQPQLPSGMVLLLDAPARTS